jgi:hypothetical protein
MNFLGRFKKKTNIKFHHHLCGGTRVVSCRMTDGWTDMTELIIAFCDFVNVPRTVGGHINFKLHFDMNILKCMKSFSQ